MSVFPLVGWTDAGVMRLGQVLRRVGYTGAAVGDRLGLPEGRAPALVDLPQYLQRLAGEGPLDTLVKLLFLGVTVSESEARTALGVDDLAGLKTLGMLVERAAGGIQATCAISGYGRLWLAHDRLDLAAMDALPDYVLGLNPPARLLAAITPRGKVERVLDLGTGCGVQAFLAAAHSRQVLGTDISSRAVAFARFNACLNGIRNVEFRQGDWYAPVAGERFDLIVSNPPYVISPDREFVFRDSGLPGDSACGRVVAGAARHLAEGGRLVMLANWALLDRDGASNWDTPVRRWVEGIGCDAWVLRQATSEPMAYAVEWNRQADSGRYGTSLERWLDYFRHEGIRSICMGLVFLRRRATGPWFVRAEEMPGTGTDGFGDQVDRLFRHAEYLQGLSSEADLLNGPLRPCADHEVVQTLWSGVGGYSARRRVIRLRGGFGFEGMLDETAFGMLLRLDGRRTLGEVAGELASAEGLEPAACAAVAARLAARLILLGFLEPVPKGGSGGLSSPEGEGGGTTAA